MRYLIPTLAGVIVVLSIIRMLMGGPEVNPILVALFLMLGAIYDEMKQ